MAFRNWWYKRATAGERKASEPTTWAVLYEAAQVFLLSKISGGVENMAKREFKAGAYEEEINVRDFIQTNYTPYEGDGAFLAGPTARTKKMMEKVN